MSLTLIIWLTIAVALVAFWWKSDHVKSLAIRQVGLYCRQQELQLLDQTMVLRSLRPARDNGGSWCLRRRYEFEFTSTGEARSKGQVEMLGSQIQKLQVDAHILPEDDRRLH